MPQIDLQAFTIPHPHAHKVILELDIDRLLADEQFLRQIVEQERAKYAMALQGAPE